MDSPLVLGSVGHIFDTNTSLSPIWHVLDTLVFTRCPIKNKKKYFIDSETWGNNFICMDVCEVTSILKEIQLFF